MKQHNKIKISTLLIIALIIGAVFLPAVSGDGTGIEHHQENMGITLDDINYSPDELRILYSEYNITENDIKFAKDELPHYRDGTILDGNTRVIATETGEPPENLIEGVDYDKIISINELKSINKHAQEKYKKKYGVDPANVKVEIVNGIPLPKKEIERLIKNKTKNSAKVESLPNLNKPNNNLEKLKNSINKSNGNEKIILEKFIKNFNAEPLVTTLEAGPSNGPHAIDRKIHVKIFEAYDSEHEPTQEYSWETLEALSRFEFIGINVETIFYIGYWSCDISETTNATQALYSLVLNTENLRIFDNQIVLGWAHNLDHNGLATGDGFYAVCSDTTPLIIDGWPYINVDWPHDSIVQHEVSHLFNASEGGKWSYEHNAECIMNYEWAFTGTNILCDSCRPNVGDNIIGDRPCDFYETNGITEIQMEEAVQAVNDYFDDKISFDTSVSVVTCYFG